MSAEKPNNFLDELPKDHFPCMGVLIALFMFLQK